jgi:hypothetical protein
MTDCTTVSPPIPESKIPMGDDAFIVCFWNGFEAKVNELSIVNFEFLIIRGG